MSPLGDFGIGMRAKEYDPLHTIRDRLRSLEARQLELEQRLATTDHRIGTLQRWREKRKRYQELRGFRRRAIAALVALNKLTFEDIGLAFGISRQRAEQLAKRPMKLGRPSKGEGH